MNLDSFPLLGQSRIVTLLRVIPPLVVGVSRYADWSHSPLQSLTKFTAPLMGQTPTRKQPWIQLRCWDSRHSEVWIVIML